VLPSVSFEPLHELFEEDSPVPKELMKSDVVSDLRMKSFAGVPDASLRINFSGSEGDDILIHRVDPENALGYSVYASEKDYFDRLSAELYEPSEEDIQGGLGE